ncbi:RNA transcription, translation and transport factor protein-like [Mya arenaria]|uniref:RNA transcription, translation and transport factor protein-like n=1 Tax=Mya arenaria TaxID=6604 RepID=UPI0022E95765|nr:RNA transcription, translation and transport factor protein-like [Mya arenaria]
MPARYTGSYLPCPVLNFRYKLHAKYFLIFKILYNMAALFSRKLCALKYHQPHNFNFSDENELRNLVVWLEDQKIRHYKIEDRAGLRNTASPEWLKAYEKYTRDLGCPYQVSEKAAVIDWLLGYAVRLDFGDEVEKYKTIKPNTLKSSSAAAPPTSQSSNPLDSLDFNDPDFKAGVTSLAMMLQIPPYQDHLEQLKAICILVKEKLSKEILEKKKPANPNEVIPIDKTELGFDTGDYIINEAAKILRLLHIKDLRELQSNINHAIVAVQELIANPKTAIPRDSKFARRR